MSLKDKTIICFGTGELAKGYTPQLAEERAKLVLVSRGDSCEKLGESLAIEPNRYMTIHADASNCDEVQRVFDGAIEYFG
tara:strand:+ start:18 stop:257 length:240 start_codon:yes stop_codon:yes gene_type:complete